MHATDSQLTKFCIGRTDKQEEEKKNEIPQIAICYVLIKIKQQTLNSKYKIV